MATTPVEIGQFGSLSLLRDPIETGATAATDMLNVEVSHPFGSVSSRGGMTRLATGTATYQRIAPIDNLTLAAFRNTGAVLAVDTIVISTGAVTSGFNYGGATTRVTSTVWSTTTAGKIFIASRAGAANEQCQGVLSNDTGAGAAPFGSPRYLSRTPWDQRIVLAHFTSAASSPSGANGDISAVFFSDAGSETITATNWIKLLPNDGEEITGVTAWGGLLFIIKRSKLFLFYGTSVAADGSPVFNYRQIDLPARARATTNGGGENMIAAANGVYLLLGDGVYRTAGDTPVRVSDQVTPLFDGTGPSTLLFPTSGDWTIGAASGRVYLTYSVSGNFRTLIYDTIAGTWLVWDLTAGQSVQPTNAIEWVTTTGLPAVYVASGAKIYSLSSTATTDDGTAISWSYTSGKYRLGEPGFAAITRESSMFGTGTPTLTLLSDLYANQSGSVTLGTAPTPALGWLQKDQEAHYFQYTISGSTAAMIENLTHIVSVGNSGLE
jgi:hypothetical protein